jgi:hypothetical protein
VVTGVLAAARLLPKGASLTAMARYAFAFDERYRWLLLPMGVHPGNSDVVIDDTHLAVRFGPWKLRTELANITGFEISGGYRWYKAIGPRGSFSDRGVTFGTNVDRGLCVRFAKPVPALVPGDMMPHPGMTVTVADVEGLADELRRRGVPG